MNTIEQLPFVSALLVTRNEKDYIRQSLMSLIEQTYPQERYELIVVDGESDDGTTEIVEELQEEFGRIRLIKNEKRILASGWNLGIKAAKGDYVVRIDAHAMANPDFIEQSVKTMLRTDAVCVGGKLNSASMNGKDDVIAMVLSSPFGVGNSSFRVSDEEGYADTAVYGLYKKAIFDKAGFFDETMVRNQDIEMHSRIKQVGGKFYFNPAIQCTYYTRNTVKKMLRQAFGNGQWNMVLLKRGSGALSLRHMVPFAFVLFLIVTIIGGFWFHPLWWLCAGVVCLHLLLGLYFAEKKTHSLLQVLQMPWLFIGLHLAYGTGYLKGII